MFLSELYKFKKRMGEDPDSGMAPEGFSEENISFVLRLTPEGELVDCLSLMTDKGKPRRLQVPAVVKRTVGIDPNFLWDNTGYVLGVDGKGKPERTAKTFAAFRERHRQAAETTGNGRLRTVAAFLDRWNPENFDDLPDHAALLDANVVFQIVGESCFIHEAPDVREAWDAIRTANPDVPRGICLITGRPGPIENVHPAIKGVAGAQSSGAALVSFNCRAFESYGKSQSLNAPVSTEAAQAYTTALNYLLRRENRHLVSIGDTAVVFWAEQAARREEDLMFRMMHIADEPEAAGEDKTTLNSVHDVLAGLSQGIPVRNLEGLNGDARFFVLGLAPNQARLAVRFWLTTSFGELAANVGRFYRELSVERSSTTQPEFPAFWQILRELAAQGKSSNLPPFLGSALARSAFSGAPFPEALHTAVLTRIHADKRVSYLRAALIKAVLTRNHRKDMPMSLDTSRQDVSYLLGRLFSILEKNQQDALGTLNASIHERYIGSASATPQRVFPLLLRLAQHHAGKSKYGHLAQKNIAAVVDNIPAFPATLTVEEQGDFFLGYYQQNNANYRKKEDGE